LISTIPVAGGPITAPGATNRHRIIKQINFDGTHGTPLADGGIEQASYSFKTGLFYIAFPSTVEPPYNAGGGVAVVDPTGDADDIRVVKVFSTPGCSPNGSALGPDNELFLGCGNPPGNGPQQVIDIRNGHLIAKIAGTNGGCDEVAFNAGDDHFAGACTEGGATDNLDVSDADPVTGALDLQHNTGAAGAHSIAADPVKESSNSTASFWMPMFQGDCGAGIACVVVYASTGGDDPSEFVVEAAEDHHRDNR